MPSKNDKLQVGNRAPAFELAAFPQGKVKLSQFKGEKNVVLYFYPRDNTPGCTTEACDFRDQITHFNKNETVVLGISPDKVESHEKFIAKFSLPFTLLSDPEHTIAEKYGVWVEKNMYGKKSMGIQRSTFLIDKAGKLAAIWPRVSVKGHVQAVAEKLKELS